jgi:hypothetical protein
MRNSGASVRRFQGGFVALSGKSLGTTELQRPDLPFGSIIYDRPSRGEIVDA